MRDSATLVRIFLSGFSYRRVRGLLLSSFTLALRLASISTWKFEVM